MCPYSEYLLEHRLKMRVYAWRVGDVHVHVCVYVCVMRVVCVGGMGVKCEIKGGGDPV